VADVSRLVGGGGRRDGGDRAHDDDRAQLFLVGALALAVVFVALALVLNSAIYTENLATREADVGADETLTFVAATEDAVGDLVHYENENRGSVDPAFVQAGVASIDERTRQFHARHGRWTAVRYVGLQQGTRLLQDVDRQFTSSSTPGPAASDWELASGVSRMRSFQQHVTVSSLEDTSLLGNLLFGSPAFRTVVTGQTGDSYTVLLHYDSGAGEAYVTVRDPGGTDRTCTHTYSTTADVVTVDITDATFAGERCPALEFFGDIDPPYTIEYQNGDRATGTWDLVVLGTPTTGNYGDPADGPQETPGIYDVTVDVTVRSSEVAFETRLGVQPGDPDA
jgi:hypothetical protein